MFIDIQGIRYNLNSFKRLFKPGEGFLKIETDIVYEGEIIEIDIMKESQKEGVHKRVPNYVILKDVDFDRFENFLTQKTIFS